MAKKVHKVPKFDKITLSTFSDLPPLAYHFFKINNIHIKEFFLSTFGNFPPKKNRLSTFKDPPTPTHEKNFDPKKVRKNIFLGISYVT